MKTYSTVITLLIILILPISTHANTFCVSDATGLQTALTTAAGNGEDDTVQIEQGTYVGSFLYVSTEAFSLTVEGGYLSDCGSRGLDPTNTILDANETGTVLVFSTPNTNTNLEVDGLTLQNGYVEGNKGGGIYADTLGNVIIANNIITGCSAVDGGGVYPYNSASVSFINNTITDNTVFNDGGGVYTHHCSTVSFINNTITGNSGNDGGGIYINYSSFVSFKNNIIIENTAVRGGGVGFYNASVSFINNTITKNSATYGGGMSIRLYNNNEVAEVTNNVIWNNTAISLGNDLYIENDVNDDYFPSPVNLFNNDFDQSAEGTYIEIPFTIDPSNLDNEDPLFVDAPNDDYHLTDLSPCIDAGSLAEAPPDDMDGHSRPQGDGVDIGADEYIPPDADEDGVPNDEDNCPTDSNPAQTDTDHDCIGDVCDDFPNDYDPTVPDSDGDGVGNDCDVCPYDFDDDIDADGLCANEDNCPDIPNGPNLGSCINILTGVVGTTCLNDGECGTGETCSSNQEDRDNDGSGDACDIGTFCRGLADFDQDVDAADVTVFLSHFGRSQFFNPCPPDGPAPVPKTGQSICYDEFGTVIDCAGTGQDGEYNKGVEPPTGGTRFTDNEDGTITDNLTGLMWLKDANCIATNYAGYDNDGTSGDGEVTWQHALDFVLGINGGTYSLCSAGYLNWRLPNVKELQSLIYFTQAIPALPPSHPFENVVTNRYWSSTSAFISTFYAWYVSISDGDVNGSNKFNPYSVWPVRGGH